MKSKKQASGPSITEAICDLLECGAPRNKEIAEQHFEALRTQDEDRKAMMATRGGSSLCLPFEAFKRDLTAGAVGSG
jgi:hypothetical protein